MTPENVVQAADLTVVRALTLFLDHEVSALLVHIFGTHFIAGCVLPKLTPRSVLILKHICSAN